MPRENIGPVENFPPNKGVCVEVGGKRVAVFNTTGQFYAIDDTCPHRGAAFSDGQVHGTHVVCPLHGAEADVRTGMCTPPAPGPVSTYEVSSDGQSQFLEV